MNYYLQKISDTVYKGREFCMAVQINAENCLRVLFGTQCIKEIIFVFNIISDKFFP